MRNRRTRWRPAAMEGGTPCPNPSALKDSGRAKPPPPDAGIGRAVLWTFADKRPPPGRRVRVRAGSSGYAHAGVAQPDGRWDPVYNGPLIPLPEGSWEALLPPRINAFMFFWTEPPPSPSHPGHWERERQGGHVFTIARPAAPRHARRGPGDSRNEEAGR
jgi:hypothetical protein